ncbi:MULTISPECIES: hypothetical protein [Nocardia]|uniref:Uncharacterized protein n=1 Tax=Nocardia iowensis TaxID=204891 RepID=A0ABX8RQH6_NOCIO|nr:hypothetical protein [Nocardia iowensis]QXN91157.1 hypothetical protein KV110_38475 [Nocardia iowensis]
MTTEPGTNPTDADETDRDDVDQPDATADAPAKTEDQAAQMDYEGDTPN